MNEVTRIRLGRIAYDIDINAKKELEKYSRAIRKSLGQDSDVYDDIEIRMTEILADQGIQAGEVITLNEVLAIESQLGQPGDFASDSNDSGTEAGTDDGNNSEPHAKAAKKYYRDVDHALAGGVLAGLSAYTGIDVTILRLIFVGLCFISFGTFFLVYIIVWMVAPPALTVGEKLEMRGEPVDLASIIEESSARLGDEIGRAGRNAKEYVQGLKVNSPTTTNNSIGVRFARLLSGMAGGAATTIYCFRLVYRTGYVHGCHIIQHRRPWRFGANYYRHPDFVMRYFVCYLFDSYQPMFAVV